MIRSGKARVTARNATALGLAAATALAGVGAAPGTVQGQVVVRGDVTLRAEPAGWIGVSIDVPVGPDGSLATPDGLLVSRVLEGSPADAARLRPGDRIVRVNGRIASVERFKRVAGNLRPGDSVQLTYEADGSRNTVTIVATERPDSPVHLLPREMVVRISSKVDSLRFYAVRGVGATPAAGSLSVTVEDGLTGGASRAAVSADDVRRTVTVQARAEPPGGPGTVPREPIHFLLGGEGIATWFESVQQPDSLREPLFDVRVGEAEPPTPLIRAFGDGGPGRVAPGETLRLQGVRSDDGREPESAPSVFTLVEQRDLVAGARLTRVGADLAPYFDVEGGLLVTEIIEGTPSTEAGLRPGDVLVEVDGQPLEAIERFRRAWASAAHDDRTLTLTLVRHGERMELRLPG